ncbi:unnamed protein product [Mytilus edulis]|uniref:Uncharacterized protein n=1 Tax=Mytilus edulis TaxID=6550 RepID=A0A8S3UFJ5_MYTED|nr:unnamed protein product [Mytilus edulis]
MATQRDNYLRINNLFHKIAEPTIDKLMENYLHRTNQSLEKFLNNTNIKHTIMHLYWNDKECCENVKDCTKSKNRPISRDKLDAYYDYGYKINSHCNVHPCLCHIIAKRIMSRDLEMPQLAFLFRQFEILNADILESVDIILKVHTKLKLDYTDQRIRANDFEKMWATLSPNLQKFKDKADRYDKSTKKMYRTDVDHHQSYCYISFTSCCYCLSDYHCSLYFLKEPGQEYGEQTESMKKQTEGNDDNDINPIPMTCFYVLQD